MNELFEKQMKELLKDEYHDFIESLQKPSIKGFYINPLKPDITQYLDHQYINKHVVVKDGYYFDYQTIL